MISEANIDGGILFERVKSPFLFYLFIFPEETFSVAGNLIFGTVFIYLLNETWNESPEHFWSLKIQLNLYPITNRIITFPLLLAMSVREISHLK